MLCDPPSRWVPYCSTMLAQHASCFSITSCPRGLHLPGVVACTDGTPRFEIVRNGVCWRAGASDRPGTQSTVESYAALTRWCGRFGRPTIARVALLEGVDSEVTDAAHRTAAQSVQNRPSSQALHALRPSAGRTALSAVVVGSVRPCPTQQHAPRAHDWQVHRAAAAESRIVPTGSGMRNGSVCSQAVIREPHGRLSHLAPAACSAEAGLVGMGQRCHIHISISIYFDT